jgi:hypothetical protein
MHARLAHTDASPPGNPGVLLRNVVNQRLVYTVHVVILRLQQKGRRRLAGDMNILEFFDDRVSIAPDYPTTTRTAQDGALPVSGIRYIRADSWRGSFPRQRAAK